MSEKLGSSISPDLSKQIQAREAKFGAATRDKATLEYLNSNTAWVKLRSSVNIISCLLYTSPSPRDRTRSRMPSSA